MTEGRLQKQLGANLRRHRKERGLSQEAFAEVIGYHRTYVGGLERGERNISLRSLERLAELLEVDALDLLETMPELDAPGDAGDKIIAPHQRIASSVDERTPSDPDS